MGGRLGWRIFVRSLLVQASWSFAAMQSTGFYLMSWPAVSRRGLSREERAAAGLRHLRDFNTHPYFGGLVAAVVAREEQVGAPAETVDALKRSLMCALGAVGDEFFWATLRPFAAIAALPAAMAGVTWAPLIALAVYNVPHVAVRAWGIHAGLSRGRDVLGSLARVPLPRAVAALGLAAAFGGGVLIGAGADDRSWGLVPGHGLSSIAAAAAVFALLLLVQRGASRQGMLLGVLSAAAVVAGSALVVLAP
jgi:mannose/fructose/N-acetylgalactosamine-specific phosphotransferase system component IID